MGRIPLDLRRKVENTTPAPMLPGGFGQAENAAKNQQGRVITSVMGNSIALVAKYAEKNKRQDIEADQHAWNAYQKNRLTQARELASGTGDPAVLNKIYSDAEVDLKSYLGGKNSDTGTPNVRWRDHQESLMGGFEEVRAGLETEKTAQKLKIYRTDTLAKLNSQVEVGIETGNYSDIVKAVDLKADGGYITQAQAADEKRKYRRKADEYRATTILKQIEGAAPEEADAMQKGFSKSVMDEKQYRNLDERTREELLAQSKRSLWRAQETSRKADRERVNKSADTLVKYQLDHNGNLPTLAEAEQMDLDQNHLLQVMKSNKPVQQRKAQQSLYSSVMKDLGEYTRKEENEQDRIQLGIRISQLPPDLKKPALELFKLKTTPGKEVVASGLQRVLDFVDTDFIWGIGGELSADEKLTITAKESDAFIRWVDETKPSDQEILDYTWSQDRFVHQREQKNWVDFKKSTQDAPPTPPPTINELDGAKKAVKQVSGVTIADKIQELFAPLLSPKK